MFDVRAFGAKGDGVTDDGAAVEGALAAAALASDLGSAVTIDLPGPVMGTHYTSKWLASNIWIPYAQGCDLSCTYSNVIVHDRSQPWAYGDVFCSRIPGHPTVLAKTTSRIQIL